MEPINHGRFFVYRHLGLVRLNISFPKIFNKLA